MIIYDLGVVVLDVQKRVKKILDNFRDCKDEFGIMDITRFAVSGDFEHGGQIDDMPDLKPRKELKRKDG